MSGKAPTALTIDVEGAEMRVLQGAAEVLEIDRPLVWLSIHPRARLAKYETSKEAILDLMARAGYNRQYLGVDHEEHHFFYPAERTVVLVDPPWGTRTRRDTDFETANPGWQDCWHVDKAPWGQD
jgi:hypothetical protein